MKKTILLLSICVSAIAANAQTTLTLLGTSPYTQNFDGLGSGLPTGWNTYNAATATSLGVHDVSFGPTTAWGAYYDTTDCPSDVFGTGFKNSASANGGASLLATSTCATQEAQTDRCLSVRQSSNTSHPGFDPGPAFCLHLSGTGGMSSLACTFKLQSLDQMSTRVTTWMVDYGFGATPTSFTAATPVGTMTTGGSTFTNNTITVNFGTALDNMGTDVWIRISTQAATTGSGSRTTSGIDDFQLTWTGSAHGLSVADVNTANELGLTVLGDATSDKINMMYSTLVAGNYSLSICDITGRAVYTQNIVATEGAKEMTINGLHLAHGMYIANMIGENSKAVTRIAVQ